MKLELRSTTRRVFSSLQTLVGSGAIVAALVATPPSIALSARSLHIGLTSSVPAKDATVMSAPREIRLTFTGTVNVATAGVELVGAAGKSVALDSLRAVPDSSKVAVARIAGTVAGGKYTVKWRAVAADGAKANGEFSFTYMPMNAPDRP